MGYVCSMLMFFCFLFIGCNSNSEKMVPVSGVVKFDGKPLSDGTVRFVPQSGRGASGKINSDGTFILGTYREDDGAQRGLHKVAVISYQELGDSSGRPDMTQSAPKIKNEIPSHYMSPSDSGLSFEVSDENNYAEIDLSSQ